ncbi:hypothetical protein CYLTODRAFT_418715 [Cylindrobasidium torrendii FP15055 ss-10]|uniref:Uncharacterized protein n=1 Tax=Cylindrobasidium torrendii FP15055 ss-10 TaxID=1314674 RepID=A0A0D7BM52_9AGAR|nr:hypothetical protein CYLTODRAFT_418715 [Cylindrobasidium torrendii FP15055 ss-10]
MSAPDLERTATNGSFVSLPGSEVPIIDEDSEDEAEDEDSELSYEQLREMYDNEEIERILHIFSSTVTEVRASSPAPYNVSGGSASSANLDDQTEERDWRSRDHPVCFSHRIAEQYVLPYLPPPAAPPAPFSFGRLRITIQRLYLFIEPFYIATALKLLKLATWEDPSRSMVYCGLFWLLWLFDLLIPALVGRVLYSLLRRRVFPYPSLNELKSRRHEVKRANYFGDVVSSKLTASSSLGVKEMWRLFRVYNKSKKIKVRKHSGQRCSVEDARDDAVHIDEDAETQEERDLKRIGLRLLEGIADWHEKVKNLFIWRRPAASKVFATLLSILLVLTLLLPAQYLIKLVIFVPGFLFWHVTPVISSMSREERARVLAIGGWVPTDSEYAMEVVSNRIATGQEVRPAGKHKSRGSMSSDTLAVPGSPNIPGFESVEKKGIDWRKWNERAAVGKAWAGEGKRLIKRGAGRPDSPPKSPLIPAPVVAFAQPPVPPREAYTYPCQHSSAPGLLTLSPTMLFFTPIMGSRPTISIPLSWLQGVRKNSLVKGLTLKLMSNEGKEYDETFRFIPNRDELFTRLIGLEGKNWMTA